MNKLEILKNNPTPACNAFYVMEIIKDAICEKEKRPLSFRVDHELKEINGEYMWVINYICSLNPEFNVPMMFSTWPCEIHSEEKIFKICQEFLNSFDKFITESIYE